MRPVFGMKSLTLLIIFLSCTVAHGGFDSKSAPGNRKGDGRYSLLDPSKPKAQHPKYKSDELLVKFKAGTSGQNSKSVHGRRGGTVVREFPRLRLHHVKLKKGMSVEEALKQYRGEPEVEYAEPNFLYSVLQQPNDPRFMEQWALRNTGQTGGTPGADINATAAWDLATGSSDVVVAIIDTGIDHTHADLSANVWTGGGLDVVNQDSSPFDDHGHGTHVAGIIGARGNNGLGVAGLNWNVKLTACKFLGANGAGDTAGAVQCLEHIKALKDAGANIVATNNSWGGGAYSQALYDAIDAQRDILFVAAAGNDSTDIDSTPSYPARYDLPNVIAVAATDHNDGEAYFSNYGSHSVHVGAPGVDILSTLPAVNTWNISGGYGTLSGTSMAAPHVSGLAALLKAQQPARDWREIRNLILAGGDKVSSLTEDTLTGRRISALGALSCSDKPLLIPLQYPDYFPFTSGTYTLSALSINCGSPAGAVTVTTSVGDSVTLHDDGVFPDLIAGDGIFTASWATPLYFMPKPVHYLKFSSPAGVAFVPSLNVSSYLPEGNLNHVYRQYVQAAGGTAPYTWSLSSGTLPDGLTLNGGSGEISGFPGNPGSYPFGITVTDAEGRNSTKQYSVRVTSDQVIEERAMTSRAPTNSFPFAVSVDGEGNTYLAGGVENGAQGDYLTVKFGPSGSPLWSQSYHNGNDEWARGVALDSGGSVYVTGGVHDPTSVIDFFTDVPFATIKYTPQGDQLWNRTFGDGKVDTATGVVVDAAGNAYVAGYNTYGYPYLHDALLVKYDAAGNQLWSTSLHAADVDRIFSVALDGSGNVYLGGTSGVHGADGWYRYQYQTLKYSPDGTLLWSRNYSEATGSDWWIATAVAAGADGSVYVSGEGLRLVKYTPQGEFVWSKVVPVNGVNGHELTIRSLAVGKKGQIYAAGSFYTGSGTGYAIAKLDAAGTILWTKEITGSTKGYIIIALTLDNNDALYVSRPFDRGMLVSVYTEPLVVEPLPVAVKGKPYSRSLPVKGGAAPYTASLAAGALPPGLAIDAATQAITGTPTASGTFPFTLQLRDASGTHNLAETVLRVHEPLELAYTDNGTGRVDFSSGASCSGPCSLSFEPGTVVTMSASAGFDSVFTGWGGACSGTGGCTVTMNGTREVGVGFKKLTTTLTLNRPHGTGSGTVQLSPGIPCTGSCSQIYDFGTEVTLTATPAAGSVFAGWGGACTGVAACTLAMTTERLVFAKFQPAGPDLPLIASGNWSGAVLRGDGTLSTWGDNVDGALGDGTAGYRMTATANPVLTGGISVDAYNHTLALKDDGTVWSWGKNDYGQLGDGTLVNQPAPHQVSGLTGMVGISAGYWHSAAVKSDGTVWGWGSNSTGAMGDGTTAQRLTPVHAGITGVAAVSTGTGYTLALKNDGTVWGWGFNLSGQLGDNTLTNRLSPVQTNSLTGVVAVSAGSSHAVALKSDGTVWTWGDGASGKLGTGSTATSKVPAKVTTLSGVVAIATGDSHTLALKSDGTVWAWGYNPFGEIGDGTTTTQRNTPVQVAGLSGVVRIAAGPNHSYAVKNDGTVWGWGDNTRGSLGTGVDGRQYAPYRVPITAATLGSDFTASATSAPAPLAVTFSDLSTGAPTSWLWNFGDGSTATAKNPVHVYTSPGGYTVSLTATSQTGSSTKTKANYISVLTCTNPPVRIQAAPLVLFADPAAAFLQAMDDDVIQLQGVGFTGDLSFDREIRVRLQGGYDCAYNSRDGSAALSGKLKVSMGTVRLDGIRLK
ncbi:S8 family serine peptidase [Geomonas subterranea]|uniref:S8 family serine peptidase n=1 Tax=Geomonas subterranea TaxID=2847989 RepID=A0ABX8LKU0_9BACT|nr:S8 family serine peptidase [Geomonas subterranea]QXE92616.1 S8 family serine peptidase [Geomonas subterranea]QXM09285.1 S8 family serine peptidase [Geomonas subterranea]